MTNLELLSVINAHCYRSDGLINGQMIHRVKWEKLGLLYEYDCLMSRCNHPSAKLAQIIAHVTNDLPPLHLCANPSCDNLAKWNSQTSSYNSVCSKSCAGKNPARVQAWRDTNFEKYGQDTYGQSTPAALNKRNRTNTKRYGVESFSKTDEFKEMMQADNPMFKVENVEKFKRTNIEKYGVEYYNSLQVVGKDIVTSPDKFIEAVEESSAMNYARRHGVCEGTVYKYLRLYGRDDLIGSLVVPASGPTKPEMRLASYLTDLGIKYTTNDRSVIGPKEVDFYLPEYKLAIEINGVYWHSTANKNRGSNYHFDKWQSCRDIGVTLLSYTDTEINADRTFNIICNKIRYLVQGNNTVIGARKCKLGQVHNKDEFALLDANHIQGHLKSRSGSLGAYYNDNLVAVINWVIRKNYLEITRYCCDTNASYPGLFSKMMKAMVNTAKYSGNIVSFSNNNHSSGNVYKSAGFELDDILGPAYWYTRDFVMLENRQKYMKTKIAKQFGIDMTGKTERQAMQELGYHRYYDSGKIKWIYKQQ